MNTLRYFLNVPYGKEVINGCEIYPPSFVIMGIGDFSIYSSKIRTKIPVMCSVMQWISVLSTSLHCVTSPCESRRSDDGVWRLLKVENEVFSRSA